MKIGRTSFVKIVRAVLYSLWIVVLAGMVGGILSIPVTSRAPAPKYAANATLYAIGTTGYAGVVEGRTILRDYGGIITSNKVCARAAESLQGISVEEVKAAVTMENDAFVMTITATTSDSRSSVAVANAVSEAFLQEVRTVSGTENIKVLDPATGSKAVSQASSSRLLMAIVFAVGAALIALAAIVLAEIFNTKVRSAEDASLDGEIEIIGTIPSHRIR